MPDCYDRQGRPIRPWQRIFHGHDKCDAMNEVCKPSTAHSQCMNRGTVKIRGTNKHLCTFHANRIRKGGYVSVEGIAGAIPSHSLED